MTLKNTCPVCHQPFEANRSGKIYCSNRCRKLAFLERQNADESTFQKKEYQKATGTVLGNGNERRNGTPEGNGILPESGTNNKAVLLNTGQLTSMIENTVRAAIYQTLQAFLQTISPEPMGTAERNVLAPEHENENGNGSKNGTKGEDVEEKGTKAENRIPSGKETSSDVNEESEEEPSEEISQEEFTDDEENGSNSAVRNENTEGTADKNKGNYSNTSFSVATGEYPETNSNIDSQKHDTMSISVKNGNDNCTGNRQNAEGKNGTLMNNGNETSGPATTGMLFGKEENDKNKESVSPETLIEEEKENRDETKSSHSVKEYKPVKSSFLKDISNIANDCGIREIFYSLEEHFTPEKIPAVKKFAACCRCLLENTLRLSHYRAIKTENLRWLIKGYDYMLNQKPLQQVADELGYTRMLDAFHEELCQLHSRHCGRDQMRLVLPSYWKIDAIVILHDIGECVPSRTFKELFAPILPKETNHVK